MCWLAVGVPMCITVKVGLIDHPVDPLGAARVARSCFGDEGHALDRDLLAARSRSTHAGIAFQSGQRTAVSPFDGGYQSLTSHMGGGGGATPTLSES